MSSLLHPAFHQFLPVTGSKVFLFHQISFYGFCLSRFGNCSFPCDLISLIDLRSLIDFQFSFFFFSSCEDVIRYLCAWEVTSVMCDSLRPYGLHSPPDSSLSIGFSRQEYWSELPWPLSGHLLNPWIELHLPPLHGRRILYRWITVGAGWGREPVWLFTCSLYITPESRGLTAL